MAIFCPLTKSNNTKVIDTYSTKEIILLYKKNGIDVTRFFINLDSIQLLECNDTGFRFFYPETIFGDNEFYGELYKTIPGYYHVNRWEHQIAKNIIQENTTLLELGCGDGFFLNSVKDKCKLVKGLELNTAAAEIARQKGLNVSSQSMNNLISQEEKFDIVCCFQVLEHIFDVNNFLNSMIKLGKINGLLIIAVPNNNPYIFKHDKNVFLNLPPHHANWWNKESLQNISKYFPIKLQEIRYEPLNELKMWYKAHINYYEKKNPFFATLLKLVPRPVYKGVLKLFRNKIEGKTVLAVFKIVDNG